MPTRTTKTVQNPVDRISIKPEIESVAAENAGSGLLTKRSEEPSVLAGRVALLQGLLDSLLCFLALRDLLEGIGSNNTLKSLQLECVTCWHQVVVVDDLDEWLDLAALDLASLGHAAGDLGWVALDTGNQCVRIWVRLVSGILWLNDHNLADLY
jgi:hypothetical protein